MYRLALVVIYIFLSVISYYLPSIFVSDSQVFVFTLISVNLLKELDWIIIKESCKNSKSKFCKLFKKKNQIIDIEKFDNNKIKEEENK